MLAKSYSAHDAGTIARPLGVSPASPRRGPGADAGPLDGRGARHRPMIDARAPGTMWPCRGHEPARSDLARRGGSADAPPAGLRQGPPNDVARPDHRAAVDRRPGPGRGRRRRGRLLVDDATAIDGRRVRRVVEALAAVAPRGELDRRRLHHQAGDATPRAASRPGRDETPTMGQLVGLAPQPGGRHAQARRGRARRHAVRGRPTSQLRRDRPAVARRQIAARRPAARAPAPAREPSSTESDVVRVGTFIRPPIDALGRLVAVAWASAGCPSRPPTAATARASRPGLGRQRRCRAAEPAPATGDRAGRAGMVRWARAPNRTHAGHPRRDRAARPGRHHGRHPELQERRDDRLCRARGAGRARPVLPGPPPGRRQLGRRLARRHRPRRRRDRAARLHRADPPRPARPTSSSGSA